jgi:hypothetical protein
MYEDFFDYHRYCRSMGEEPLPEHKGFYAHWEELKLKEAKKDFAILIRSLEDAHVFDGGDVCILDIESERATSIEELKGLAVEWGFAKEFNEMI